MNLRCAAWLTMIKCWIGFSSCLQEVLHRIGACTCGCKRASKTAVHVQLMAHLAIPLMLQVLTDGLGDGSDWMAA